jgi:hypothetical protein
MAARTIPAHSAHVFEPLTKIVCDACDTQGCATWLCLPPHNLMAKTT